MATQTLTRPALRTQPAANLRQPRKKMTAGRAAVLAVAAILAILWLVPFAWATVTAVRSAATVVVDARSTPFTSSTLFFLTRSSAR